MRTDLKIDSSEPPNTGYYFLGVMDGIDGLWSDPLLFHDTLTTPIRTSRMIYHYYIPHNIAEHGWQLVSRRPMRWASMSTTYRLGPVFFFLFNVYWGMENLENFVCLGVLFPHMTTIMLFSIYFLKIFPISLQNLSHMLCCLTFPVCYSNSSHVPYIAFHLSHMPC
jgi:hypothetical protein